MFNYILCFLHIHSTYCIRDHAMRHESDNHSTGCHFAVCEMIYRSIPDNSLLVGQRWATSSKSVGPPEAATGGPPSFCPLGQHWPTSGNTLVEIL